MTIDQSIPLIHVRPEDELRFANERRLSQLQVDPGG